MVEGDRLKRRRKGCQDITDEGDDVPSDVASFSMVVGRGKGEEEGFALKGIDKC